MSTTTSASPSATVAALLAAVPRGSIRLPGDHGYDDATLAFYGGPPRRPAAVVRPADAAEVAATVRVARDTATEFAVRGGGHGLAGHGLSDGGLVLDLARLRELDFDLERRTVWAQTGLRTGELTRAAAEHGLAVGFGDAGSVGIGGITLGGGIGLLSRAHGLTIDSLLAAEIVTADGQVRRIDADAEPDLFWALRGGGGNFGVVTRLRFGLQPVAEVYGGMLALPATAEVVAGLVEAAAAADDELTIVANVMVAPPMPFLPAELHGKLVVLALLTHCGDQPAAERAVAGIRSLAPPLFDDVRSRPYAELFDEEPEDFHPRVEARTFFRDSFDLDTATSALDRLLEATAPMAAVQIRVLGGAIARVAPDATAYAHRERGMLVNVAAMFETEQDRAAQADWVHGTTELLREPGVAGAYVNFLAADDEAGVPGAYPGDTHRRLQAVKRRYDPTNLFRRNHNIVPG